MEPAVCRLLQCLARYSGLPVHSRLTAESWNESDQNVIAPYHRTIFDVSVELVSFRISNLNLKLARNGGVRFCVEKNVVPWTRSTNSLLLMNVEHRYQNHNKVNRCRYLKRTGEAAQTNERRMDTDSDVVFGL